MEDHLTMRNRPEDVHAYYASIASNLGSLTITRDLDMRAILPVQGVIADYTAHLTDDPHGPTRHVGTLKEKPTKFSLALGKTFVAEAAEYVRSQFFTVAIVAPEIVESLGRITHRFSLEMRADLPLNGKESTEWLNNYANLMLSRASSGGARLERLKALNAPAVIIEPMQTRYDAELAAYKRAEEILKRK